MKPVRTSRPALSHEQIAAMFRSAQEQEDRDAAVRRALAADRGQSR